MVLLEIIVLFKFYENAVEWSSLVRAISKVKQAHVAQGRTKTDMTSDGNDEQSLVEQSLVEQSLVLEPVVSPRASR